MASEASLLSRNTVGIFCWYGIHISLTSACVFNFFWHVLLYIIPVCEQVNWVQLEMAVSILKYLW